MTDAVAVALAASIAPTLAACGGITVGLLNSRKADVIHDAVNGGLSAAKQEIVGLKEELGTANTRISQLEAMVRRLTRADDES